MKFFTAIITVFCMLAAQAAIAADQINPLTGEPIKQQSGTSSAPEKKPQASTQNATSPPYVPAPQMYTPPQVITATNPAPPVVEKEKKREIKPEERFTVDGIVNNIIVIRDLMFEDRYIHVVDMSILDNGCLVKYPSILCGEAAKKAIRQNEDKEEITQKLVNIAKELARTKQSLAEAVANTNEHQKRIKQLEGEAQTAAKKNADEITGLKAKLAGFDKVQIEKKNIEAASIDIKKKTETELAAMKKKAETELETLRKNLATAQNTIKELEPKYAAVNKDIATCTTDKKELKQDMAMLTSILFMAPIGGDYNIPKIGKFKAVMHDNYTLAFVPVEEKIKADAYMSPTLLRAYKSDKYILYINNKKLLED